MDDSDGVRSLKRTADLEHDFDRVTRREGLAIPYDRAQVGAFDVLHSDELHAIRFAEVVNADHVAMRDLMREHQFLLEPFDDGGVGREVGTNDFQGDDAIDFSIERLVHRAHASAAEDSLDFVALSQNRAWQK